MDYYPNDLIIDTAIDIAMDYYPNDLIIDTAMAMDNMIIIITTY